MPACPFNFIFDEKNRCYEPTFTIKKESRDKLNELMHECAIKKINSYKEKLKKSICIAITNDKPLIMTLTSH